DRSGDRRRHQLERDIVGRGLAEHRREPGGDQPDVLLAQWDVQLLCQAKDERPARRRATGLDESEMPRRYLRSKRQLELRQPASAAPFAKMLAERLDGSKHR